MRERGERPEPAPAPADIAQPATYAPVVNWWILDPSERAETLLALSEWVSELTRRYGLTDQVVPPCWFRHEALVQELLALFQYRDQQQVLPVAPPGAMLDFHYQFDLAINRMRRWRAETGCTTGEHLETRPQLWAIDGHHAQSVYDVDLEEVVREVLEQEPSL